MNKLVKVYFTLFALLMSSTGVWAQETITYLNYVGGTAVFEEATHTATQITSSSTEVSISGWNYVEGDVTISNQVTLTGDTHLILCDGAKLTINSSYDGVLYDSGAYNLTIYAQSSGSHAGKLIINSDNAGIDYCISGNVTINGGNISINSGGYGICCSQLTLNGGVVTVNSCLLDGILARIDFTINGGKVSATGNEKGIRGDGAANVIINGGQVYAEGNDAGIHSHQPINLGWTNASDYIEASSYSSDMSIDALKNFYIDGTTSLDAAYDIAAATINDKTLTPNTTTLSYDINVSVGITGGTIEVDKTKAFAGERVAITVTPETGKMLTSLTYNDGTNTYTIGTGYYDIKRQANDYVFTMPAANVTVNATFETVVAKIGTTEYPSLDDAFSAVGDGETIDIFADIDESATNHTPAYWNLDFVIDLHGHDVKFGDISKSGGDLTIKSTETGGKFLYSSLYDNNGNITIDNVTMTCTGSISSISNVTIKNSTVTLDEVNNPNGNLNETFLVDGSTVVCKDFSWMAKHIELKNGANVEITNSFQLGSGDDGITFTIDKLEDPGSSVFTLTNCTVRNGYGQETLVKSQMEQYVQPGKTIVVDGSTKNSMILKKEWGMMFVNCLPDSPVKTATVTAYKSATEPTEDFISAPGDVTTEFNANEYVVVHIVPEYGFWTDAQLLMATETGASLAPKRAPGLELGRPLKLLKADEGRNDGAGWYYYQIPATHTAAAGYLTTQLDGFVPTKFMFNLHNISMSNNVLTVAQEDDPNVGWKAEITFDPAKMSFAFDGNEHKPVVTKIEVKKDNELGATLTSGFDNQFTIDGDKRIGKRSIVIHAVDNSWFSYNLNTGSTGSGSCGDATFNITIPLSGSGTEDDPWQINNVSDMNLFAQCVNVGEHPFCHPDPTDPSENISEYVKLFNNLSYNEVSNAGFEPIGLDDGTMNNGVYDADFCGIFDGNNKTISNIYYTNNLTSRNSCALGLFGEVNYGGTNTSVIKNLTLNNCTFKGGNYGNRVGALAGDAAHVDISGITITNCTVEGPVTPSAYTETYIGGLVSSVEGNSKVSGCSISGSTIKHAPTTASICNMGGLVGLSHKSEISDCVVENCTLNSLYSNMVGGIVGKVYQATIKDNRVKGNKPISGNTTAGFCRMGAICGGSDADMSNSTFTNNYYDYGITLGYTHSGGTATANGYTKRGYMNIQWDELSSQFIIGWDDITENDGAKMRVFPVNLSVTGSAAFGKTVEMDPDPSTSDIEAWTAGTNCYSLDGSGNPSIAVGDVVNLVLEPTIYRVDDGRTYHAELSMNMNDVAFDLTSPSFTMPNKTVNLDAVYTEANWFTVATNGKKWMTFYQEWNENTDPTVGPVQANYLVTDPANAATTPTFELLTISRLDGTRFETQNLEGISYNSVPTLLRGKDADGKDANLPAMLRFDLVVDGSNLREPSWVEVFKGVNVETEFNHGIYVMNGNGDFIYGEPDPTDNKLKAHRCYIDLNGNQTNGAPLRWSGETNLIENVELTVDSDSWYTISGMKLNGKPMKQGVYINGGKKVTIK